MKKIELKSFAKINLSIDVLSKREDGFHEVSMVMQQIDLWDTIKIKYFEEKAQRAITIETNDLSLPTTEKNLVFKTASIMQRAFPKFTGNIHMEIVKKIPIGAGLGGGSANAASVFHGLNKLWGLKLKPSELMEMAVEVGADVPFLIMSQAASTKGLYSGDEKLSTCALAEGIGEKIRPLPPLKAMVVLKKLDIFVSTKEIYQALELSKIKKRPDTEKLIEGLNKGDFNQVTASMYNVLEEVTKAKYPEIGEEIEFVKKLTGLEAVMMTGSGPTVFAMVDSLTFKEE